MEIFGSIFEYVAKVIACFLIIDFLSGLFHWLEDSYGRPNWPVTGRLVTQANILHHYNPRHFTQHSWLASAWILMVIVTMCLGVAYVIGLLNWMTWLVALRGYVNRCVNDIRRRPSQPLIQWRFHPHTVHRGRRLRSTQGPSDA